MADETTLTGAENQDATQAGDKPKAETGLSQKDVDRIVKERLAREESKWKKRLEESQSEAVSRFREEHALDDDVLGELGNRDQKAKAERAAKSELTRAKNEAESWKKKHDDIRSMFDSIQRKQAVYAAATEAGAVDPEDVWLRLSSRIRLEDDLSIGVLDDEGNLSVMGIKEAVADLLEKKRHLKSPQGVFAGSGSRASEPRPSDNGQSSEFWKSREGRLAHLQRQGVGK